MHSSGSSLLRRTRCWRDTRGAALTEYTVLVGSVALVCIGALIALGAAFGSALDVNRTFLLAPLP